MSHAAISRAPVSVLALVAMGALRNGAIFNEAPAFTDSVIDSHRDRQSALMESSQGILARAESETRDLTEAEQTEVDGLNREFESIENQIALRTRTLTNQAALTSPRGRRAEPDDIDDAAQSRVSNAAPAGGAQRRAEPRPNATARGTNGFRNVGEFALQVRMASMRGGEIDARLRNAALGTYGNEGTGADGGFAVPPDFRSDIMSQVYGEDSLIALTDQMQSSSNTLTLPVDMTTPWGSTGVNAYWVAEGGTKTQSKPALEEITVKLHTLAALVPVTEELLEDAPAMDSYLRRKVPEKMDFAISNALAWGNGVGKPLGWMNSPSLVTVAAESAQTAATVNATNLMKMWGRMPVRNRRTAVWLMNPDVESTMPGMVIGTSPVYLPPGGLSGSMFGTLFGRPVIPHEVAQTLGTLGDVMLVDPASYLSVTKTGGGRGADGMKIDVSIHLWFDQDAVAYRFTMRVAGQPWWSAPITPNNGSNKRSPFITLAAR